MALRDKLRERVTSQLNGEQVETVFLAQTGPSPYFALLSTWIIWWTKRYVIAVTGQRIVVFRASIWTPTRPKTETFSEPRGADLGDPGKGLWRRFELGGARYWVHRRFRDDVLAASQTPVR